jgi:hypothetical protein
MVLPGLRSIGLPLTLVVVTRRASSRARGDREKTVMMVMVWLVGALSERMRTRGFWRSESELETQTGISRGLWHAKYMFFGQATSATFLVHPVTGPVSGGGGDQKQTRSRPASHHS